MVTSEKRVEAIRAMVDELVDAGLSREDAEAHVRKIVIHEFDVIEVRPDDSHKRAERARQAFRDRAALAHRQRMEQKVAAGVPRERAERVAAMELSTEGDRGLPPGLIGSDDSDGAP